jgi:hypothetical protein
MELSRYKTQANYAFPGYCYCGSDQIQSIATRNYHANCQHSIHFQIMFVRMAVVKQHIEECSDYLPEV